jgi:NDP-sugar pyrophosphorylase family protein
MPRINKAMILAAGFGKRLEPLTLKTPKPMLLLGNKPIIEHQVEFLKKFGITDIIINTHHLGKLIKNHMGDGSKFGIAIQYTQEDRILGIGGGIKNAQHLFNGDTILTINAKGLSDCNLNDVIDYHFSSKALATMVLIKKPSDSTHTGITIDKENNILSFGNGEFIYTGIQLLSPRFLNTLPPAGTPAGLIDEGYKRLISDGESIKAFIHDGNFAAIETIQSYNQAKKSFESGKFFV